MNDKRVIREGIVRKKGEISLGMPRRKLIEDGSNTLVDVRDNQSTDLLDRQL